MNILINDDIASRLDEVAAILKDQGAGHYRVQAYHRAAAALRGLKSPVSELFNQGGLKELERIPGIGESIARSISDLLRHGKLAMLERLRGKHDPIALLRTVSGIGQALAWRLHEDLNIESLEDLEAAAHDGRLESWPGFGPKRLAGIRDTLAQRLGRVRTPGLEPSSPTIAPVAELLEVDAEYRAGAKAGTLKTITPHRFNPEKRAWLPVLHATRRNRHYTALFSNTAHAHRLHKTRDWVVIYDDSADGERPCTVITSEFGTLKGKRIVRGREDECEAFYNRPTSQGAIQSTHG